MPLRLQEWPVIEFGKHYTIIYPKKVNRFPLSKFSTRIKVPADGESQEISRTMNMKSVANLERGPTKFGGEKCRPFKRCCAVVCFSIDQLAVTWYGG